MMWAVLLVNSSNTTVSHSSCDLLTVNYNLHSAPLVLANTAGILDAALRVPPVYLTDG